MSSVRSARSPIIILLVCSVAVFGLSGWLWWAKVYENPDRVYWDMMANSLQASSVTRRLTQKSTKSSLDQTVVQTFGGQQIVQSITTLQQGSNTISTENIGTASKDYIRYLTIQSDQKNTSGKPLDFSTTLNKWAQTSVPNIVGQKNPSLVTQISLGLAGGNLIPQAYLQSSNRDKLITLLHNTVVFDTDTSAAKRSLVNGRPQYTYASSVQAVAYVGYQKELAKLLGLHLLDTVNPNDYQGQAPTKVEIAIDAWSHQLVSVNYVGQNRMEQYSAYGVAHQITVPNTTLTGEQLQELVNKVD